MKWRFIILFFSGILLAACHDQKKESAEQNVQHMVKNLESASEALKTQRQEEILVRPVAYQGAGLRDPFEIPALVKNIKIYPNAILTNTALDSLKLRGVVLHANHRWAILQAEDGRLYRVTEGVRVGLQQALLTQIDPDAIKFSVDMDLELGQKSHDVVMTVTSEEQESVKK